MDQHMLPVEWQVCLNAACPLVRRASLAEGCRMESRECSGGGGAEGAGQDGAGAGLLALEEHWNRLPREMVESPPLPAGVRGMTGRGIQCSALAGRMKFGQRLDLDLIGLFQQKGFCGSVRRSLNASRNSIIIHPPVRTKSRMFRR